MKTLNLTLSLLGSLLLCTSAFAQRDIFQEIFPNPSLIATNPNNANNFIVGGGDGTILVTQDAGDTWQLSGLRNGSGFGVSGIAFLGQDTVFASTHNNAEVVYRSVDGGLTWTALKLPFSNAQSRTFVQPTRIPGVVLLGEGINGCQQITRNGGVSVDTFQRTGTIVALGTGTLLSISPSFNSTTTYRSDDLGVTWSFIARASHGFQVFLDGWDVHSFDDQKWIIRSERQSEILVTDDGGASLVQVDPGVRNVEIVEWRSATEVIAHGSTRTAISQDGGFTWELITFEKPATPWEISRYAIDAEGNEIACYDREVFTREAGANGWDKKRFYLPFERILNFIIGPDDQHFINFNNANRPEYSSFYTTNDNGVTWQVAPFGISDYRPMYIGTQGEIYAVKESNVLYRSNDGGSTYELAYTTQSTFTRILRVFSPGEGVIVAFLNPGVAVSKDNGQTWSDYDASNVYLAEGVKSIASLTPGTWAITVSSGQFFAAHLTQDTGRTFTQINRPGQTDNKPIFAGGGALWMAPKWTSSDNGVTWQEVQINGNSINFETVSFRTPDNGILQGSGTFYYTDNGGATWLQGFEGLGNRIIGPSGWSNNGTKGFVAGNILPLFRLDLESWDTIQVAAVPGGTSNTQEVYVEQLRLTPNPARPGEVVRIFHRSAAKPAPSFLLLDGLGRIAARIEATEGSFEIPVGLSKGLYHVMGEKGHSAGRLLVQ